MCSVKKILFAIDLEAKESSHIVAALNVAKMLNSEIHILYVNDAQAGYRHPTDREDAVALRVREVVEEDVLSSAKITYAISKGNLTEEVAKYCKDNHMDLIIVGHKHRPKIYDEVFDSPDVKIIDTVNIPVLVIPQK